VNTYLLLKLVHIISAAVLFGTGMGIAFFMFRAHRSGNIEALRVVTRNVILADWIFTATAVLAQPLSGALLMFHAGYALTSPWFGWVAALYLLTGACWIPVVVLQYRMARYAARAATFDTLPAEYYRCFRAWILLGIPAFTLVIALYVLMVYRAKFPI
jgi:uncharacterized membrane protein